jgi:aminoglycoside phosphotransferase (APT) family kinase protein
MSDQHGRNFVLRRPPTGNVLHSAHDMGREWTFITALRDTAVPVPAPLAHCDDDAVIGAPFYVIEHVGGVVVDSTRAASEIPVESRRPLAFNLVSTMAAMHALDPRQVGHLIRDVGYLNRQLRRWSRPAWSTRSAVGRGSTR